MQSCPSPGLEMGDSGGGKNGACEEKIASQESVMEILSDFTGITASDLITSAFNTMMSINLIHHKVLCLILESLS